MPQPQFPFYLLRVFRSHLFSFLYLKIQTCTFKFKTLTTIKLNNAIAPVYEQTSKIGIMLKEVPVKTSTDTFLINGSP